MVFQHFNLLSSRTVQDNVELPLEILKVDRRERSRKALELLDLVGLADKAKAYPAQLSGGQKQRVGIARALAGDPKVLLSDEATSALDPETTRSILQLLRDLNRKLGLTVVLITHEMDVVKTICDSAALMKNGRVIEQGTVAELLATPGSELARELFPVGGEPSADDRTVVDVTFHGSAATRPVISELSRTYNVDVSILGAAMDTVGGKQIGRMRIELPGPFEENVVPIGFLREQGLQVDVVDVDGSVAAAPPPTPPASRRSRLPPPRCRRKVPSDLERDAAAAVRQHARHPLHGVVVDVLRRAHRHPGRCAAAPDRPRGRSFRTSW